MNLSKEIHDVIFIRAGYVTSWGQRLPADKSLPGRGQAHLLVDHLSLQRIHLLNGRVQARIPSLFNTITRRP